jgi:8-hydroxy-5-deazaflavin:NADPH oxidoreductase
MSTAIIGVGNIGSVLAERLVAGGEPVVLAARKPPEAAVKQLGGLASAAKVSDAIEAAEVVIFAVMFDVMKELVSQHFLKLDGKVVVDPSNPVARDDKDETHRSLPDGVSSGSVIADLLPPTAHFVKAFGTLSSESLREGANRTPTRAVLFYATNDDLAQAAIERLISAAGFDPVKAGGVDAAFRIELNGDLHQYGGLHGKLIDKAEALAAIGAVPKA